MNSDDTGIGTNPDGTVRRLLIVGGICAGLVGIDALVTAPLAPVITSSTGVSADLAGLLVATYSLVYAVTGTLFGPVSDRLGRRKVIIAGLVVFAAGTALTGVLLNFTAVLVFRAIAGLGASMMVPSIFAAVSDVVPAERRGAAIGIIMGALTGSSLIGLPLGAFLADALNWRVTFLVLAVLAVLAVIGVPLALPPMSGGSQQRQGSPVKAYVGQFRAAFSNRSVILVLLCTVLWTAGNQAVWANIGVFYKLHFNLSTTWIGGVLFVVSLVGLLGTIFGGRLADRVRKPALIAGSGLGVAVSILLFSLITNQIVVSVVVASVWVLAFNIGVSTITTQVSLLSPSAQGTALAMNSSGLYAGATIGTTLSAAILSSTGSSFFWLGALCAACCLLVFPLVLSVRGQGAVAAEEPSVVES